MYRVRLKDYERMFGLEWAIGFLWYNMLHWDEFKELGGLMSEYVLVLREHLRLGMSSFWENRKR